MGDYLQEKDSFLQQQQDADNAHVLINATTSTITTVMLFGSIIFTTASLAARLWLTGLWSWRNNHHDNKGIMDSTTKSQPLDTTSLPSIYSLLYYSTVFGLILFYSYICEHHPPFFHEEKTYDRDEFFFWTILVVVFAGGHSLRKNEVIKRRSNQSSSGGGGKEGAAKNLQKKQEEAAALSATTVAPSTPENEVLNRYQTEEWKGWMQFTFLLYHYMHATEIYNGIRVMITCYVWMTGFGNFSFFYMTNDYSLPRVLQMLWRLNFLVFFLCLTHGTPYILYYICPLHTYFFFMVYAVMSIGKEQNYTKWWIRIKLGVTAFIIYVVWDCDTGLKNISKTKFS